MRQPGPRGAKSFAEGLSQFECTRLPGCSAICGSLPARGLRLVFLLPWPSGLAQPKVPLRLPGPALLGSPFRLCRVKGTLHIPSIGVTPGSPGQCHSVQVTTRCPLGAQQRFPVGWMSRWGGRAPLRPCAPGRWPPSAREGARCEAGLREVTVAAPPPQARAALIGRPGPGERGGAPCGGAAARAPASSPRGRARGTRPGGAGGE